MALDKHIAIVILDISRIEKSFSSSSYALGKSLAEKGFRVIHINNPLSIKDIFNRKRLKSYLDFAEQSKRESKLFSSHYIYPILSINWLPKGSLYKLASKLNNMIFNKYLDRILSSENVDKFIFVNSFNPFYSIISASALKGRMANIYQSVDLMRESNYIKKHGTTLEQEYAKEADLVLVSSRALLSEFPDSLDIHLLENAADARVFQNAPKETSMLKASKADNKKIIGFFGHLDPLRIDVDLIIKTAKYYSNEQVVLIGPNSLSKSENAKLKALENIIFIPPVNYESLGAYLYDFDCCIIPFKINELTKYIYPLKLNEYLSLGKAVVSTNFSDDLDSYSDLAYISDNHDSFIQSINNALSENSESEKKRIQRAEKESWNNRAERFINLVNSKIL